jgi:hypothetical protein
VLLRKYFVNRNEGEEQGALGASLGSTYNVLRREIDKRMPTGGIRFIWTVLEIKETI